MKLLNLAVTLGINGIFIILLFGCQSKQNQRSEEENKELIQVLFIGNSQTYENCGIDCHLRRLVMYSDLEDKVIIKSATRGRFHLSWHWKDEQTKAIINHEKWDKVVLQEYTRGPKATEEEFNKYVKLWKERLAEKNPNVDVVLLSIWGYKKKPEMAAEIESKCRAIAKEINGNIVPVGRLWEELRSEVDLYMEDGAHPNRTGTFLTACLFYEYLFKKDVRKTSYLDPLIPTQLQIKLKSWAHNFHKENP